jgi:Family of unknown function (DUF6510)
MTENDEFFLDGNAAAGPLLELFGVDLTTATGQCDQCGRIGALADTRLYDPQHGMVLRCPGCGGILMRLVEHDTRIWLDLRGLTFLEIHKPA